VTVTKTLEAGWASIQSEAISILEDAFPG